MKKIDLDIISINKVICSNISILDSTERGLLSQNILSQLRTFVEHISLKAYSNGADIENTYGNITKANAFVKARGNLKFLSKLHKLLQITASHYTLDAQNSERLMLKYYEYLLKIKSYLKTVHNLDVLENINRFPVNTDENLREYYGKIAEQIEEPALLREKSLYDDRYYIQKVKPFFVNSKVYYEVTFTTANDKTSKFDRIIAFTQLEILQNYAVKLSICNSCIQILGKSMPIQIIDKWDVSIRPCELNNFAKIFGTNTKFGNSKEAYELMIFLTQTGFNLVELIDFSEYDYEYVKKQIKENAKSSHILDILDKCRKLSQENMRGRNVIRYLLYKLNNKILKKQFASNCCEILSNLHLSYSCIPFDDMPFNTSLINHNPKLSDLFDCIDSNGKDHEIFARFIKNNTEIKGQLYSSIKDIKDFVNVDKLMQTYNNALYYKHTNRILFNYKDHIYIKGYEDDTVSVINKLKELSLSGVAEYSRSVEAWLLSSTYHIDCEEKKGALIKMFEDSKVALIYGSAGTGKSTLINHVSIFFNDKKKLYLANTNPAVDNLNRRVVAANCTFKTITKFLSSRNDDTEYDLLIIDECSTVSNSDMLKVLTKAAFKLLILVGDTFQIESILFGNWFYTAQVIIPESAISELQKTYRSDNLDLLLLWSKVRSIDEDILEHITKKDYSVTLDESIFERSEEDEIILCLNYDGLYGINNINRFLQSTNNNNPIHWGIQIYKVDDPILFNETNRFAPLIYNNLKGKIIRIEKEDEYIQFDIEIDRVINELDAADYEFQLIEKPDNENSVIRFIVNKYNTTDEDDNDSSDAVVPFQIAYAVSIHKAQGLEHNSVKVVITNEIEEMVTHNIFYTAITRAKKALKIYWTPETESKVLKGLKRKSNAKDISLLRSKFSL